MSQQAVTGPTQTAVKGASHEWPAKPFVAGATRATILLFPYVVGFAVALVLSVTWPPSQFDVHPLFWWAAIAVASTLAMIPADRFIRRFVPLTSLLNVAITFPDVAPSRFRTAMRSTTTGQARRRVAAAVATSARGNHVDRSLYMLDLVALLTDHDRLTRGHSERVRAYSTLIGEELRLSKSEQQKLYWAALLHDIGKLEVPSAILNKPGRPTQEEWSVLQNHPAAGTKYLAPLRGWLGAWVGAADEHHLRWDGKGYPRALGGTEISAAGRIVAVADAYDVMTSARSYKAGMSAADARVELSRCAGGQFDPAVVRAFLQVGLARMRLVASPLPSLPVMASSVFNGAATTAGKVLLATTALAAAVAASPQLEAPRIPELLAYVQDAPSWLVSVDDSSVLVTYQTQPAATIAPSTPTPDPTVAPTLTPVPSRGARPAEESPPAPAPTPVPPVAAPEIAPEAAPTAIPVPADQPPPPAEPAPAGDRPPAVAPTPSVAIAPPTVVAAPPTVVAAPTAVEPAPVQPTTTGGNGSCNGVGNPNCTGNGNCNSNGNRNCNGDGND